MYKIYRFLSSSLDKLVEISIDNSHISLGNPKKEIVGDDNILNIVNEIEKLLDQDENNRLIKGLKKDYREKIINLEEPFIDYIGEKDIKNLKTGFPDKWK